MKLAPYSCSLSIPNDPLIKYKELSFHKALTPIFRIAYPD